MDPRLLLLAVFFASQAFLAVRLDTWTRPSAVTHAQQGGAPRFSSTVRAAADLTGLRVLVGHMFWFRIIQYYGDSANARRQYENLYAYCNLAADLNPHFTALYQFGAAPLAFHLRRPEEAVALLERGIRANPDSARLQLLLAAIGYQNRSQWENVIPLLEAQVKEGDAPAMLVNILANTYKSAGRYDDAIRLWKHIQKKATTDEQRIVAARKLQELFTLVHPPSTSPR